MAKEAAKLIMNQEATQAQIGAFLIAMKLTGKEDEPAMIAAVASAMRDASLQIDFQGQSLASPVVDIVGTGGDGQNTFNVSSASGIVAAGAGCCVAKHGNRASSSACGSADFFEALDCHISNVTPASVPNILAQGSFCFLFSQVFHPAMKQVAGPRKQIGVRTIFNILGPLTNPARPKRMIVGVYSKSLGCLMAESLRLSGVERAWVVNGAVGLDEIAPIGETFVWSLENDAITEMTIRPSDFGLPEHPLSEVVGGDAQYNANFMLRILSGELKESPILDFILLNSAALIHVAGKASTLKEGVRLARESIACGKAMANLVAFREATKRV
ncbi:anthranilate phosphoribosyltransferase [Chytridiales sp. JEL 0842]|nr:anthranilate phosphoribosyltransferase [Chytridiales sp. JEL 0842]